MRYRTLSLTKQYIADVCAKTASGLGRFFACIKKAVLCTLAAFDSSADWLANSWEESLLRRYFSCLGRDAVRGLALMQARGYVGICLSLCAIMTLGFLVNNPPSPKPSYRVRIDVSRPVITPLTPREALDYQLTAYDLAAVYQAITGDSGGWFSSGELNYSEAVAAPDNASITRLAPQKALPKKKGTTWLSSRSPFGVEDGQLIMRTSLGSRSVSSLGEVPLYTNSTARPYKKLNAFAGGTASQEELLAELAVQALADGTSEKIFGGTADPLAVNWQRGKFGIDSFAGPRRHWSGQYLAQAVPGTPEADGMCLQDRMERASWLNMLYASHSKRTSYANKKAGNYRPFVEHYASRYSLPPSLVYAIMRVESGFNPLAVSHANALGLMQVVPTTAGSEVHAYLRGKKLSPAPEVLFAPESNIQYGTTYLYLLMTRHFKDIKNPISRELCIIAAYNGGPNAVYRVFSRNRDKAVEDINKLTAEQLYETLLKKLPSQETRDYLPRVLAARNDYLRSQVKMPK